MAVLAGARWLFGVFISVGGMIAAFFNSFNEDLNILASSIDTEAGGILVIRRNSMIKSTYVSVPCV
jgi:hypothetical protein